jgi:putative membrane protein
MPTRGPAPEWLALLNTSLILISGVFLLLGYYFIKQRQIELHKRSMLTATTFAALFLVVYVTRALLFETKVFAGEGVIRVIYLTILVSHTILAILVGPFALITLRRALRGEYPKHRQIARITFPMWLYVVVTGWMIYWMLHAF